VAIEADETELIVLPAEHLAKSTEPVSVVGRPRGEPRYYLKQADWSLWRKADRVTLFDAILLSVDLNPDTEPRNVAVGSVKLDLFKGSLQMIDATSWQRLERRVRLVNSSLGTTLRLATEGFELSDIVRLPVFGDWADLKELQVPQAFPRLTARQAKLPSGWPWGTYDTPLLKDLAAAVQRFWIEYKPESAPTKPQVIAWLRERGRTLNEATAIAQIIRPPSLPGGPRRKKDSRKG
jgi:hypothetical protein